MGACFKNVDKSKEKENEDASKGLLQSKNNDNLNTDKKTNNISSSANDNELKINQEMLVKKCEDDPKKNYIIEQELGSGAFGSVYKVVHKATGIERAMKKINKKNAAMSDASILNEIEMLKKLDHINLVKVYEFYASKTEYHIITEYCAKGELFDKIKEIKHFEEKQASYIIYQLLSAMHFCHTSNIIHRDLKPENILIENNLGDNFYDIKVIDFGTAKIFNPGQDEKLKIGSAYYMAPEVLNKKYNEKCDLWSVGVIMYILLSGVPPFYGDKDEDIYKSIKKGEYDLDCSPFNRYSKSCKDLIKKLIEMNPNKRLSAEQALKHDWFNKTGIKEKLFSTAKKNIKKMLSQLCNYKPNYKLQQVAIAFIVHNISQSDEVKRIFNAFQLIDENGDGRITKEELTKGLKEYDPTIENPEEYVEKIFNSIDTDNNGFLEFEEFARVIIDKKQLLTDDIIKYAFSFFDKDKSGEITVEELYEIFGSKNADKIKQLVDEVDTDKNGKIDFNEFKEMMKKIMV